MIPPNEVIIGLFMLHVEDGRVDLARSIVSVYRDACRKDDAEAASLWEGRIKAWLRERGENVDD